MQEPDLFMGMAEHLFNPNRRVRIDPVAPHYLFYDSKESHRFSSVIERQAGLICRREISYFSFEAAGNARMPIERLPTDSLFVSLLFSEYDANYNRVELQKEYLELLFR